MSAQPQTAGRVRHGTAIEWTHLPGTRGETWNPVTGCSEVSPGCAHCYAKTFAERWRGVPGHPYEHGFDVQLRPERLEVPLRWRKPRTVFVNSMSDLFHEAVPLDFIVAVFATMAAASQHTFQVLTKRPEQMRAVLAVMGRFGYFDPWPLPNVWLGVSIENRGFVHRADELRETPAAVRFISAEPLLGPLAEAEWKRQDYPIREGRPRGVVQTTYRPPLNLDGISWLIVGAESGSKARPMRLEWARDLVAAARAAGTAPFVKQLGSVLARELGSTDRKGGDPSCWPEDLRVREMPAVRA
jgi:protein gp37